MSEQKHTRGLAPFLPLRASGISINDETISLTSEKHPIVIAIVTNACSLSDFLRGDTALTQHQIANEIVTACNNHDALVEALEVFISRQPLGEISKVINKKLKGFEPVTVTVTKDQYCAALMAISRAKGESHG